MSSLSVIVVEKTGVLKSLSIKEYSEDMLYKKAGFKSSNDFIKQYKWKSKSSEGDEIFVSLYAKSNGKANSENKYEFPPPVDTKLFFGNCILVASKKSENETIIPIHLTILMWNSIYEKLFGGFINLNKTAEEDDKEEDELDNIPENKKTKIGGYLKDGFVVDDELEEEEYDSIY